MRILISAYACDPKRGGEFNNGWTHVKNLVAMGYEVHCITNVWGRKNIEEALENSPMPNLHIHFQDVPQWLEELYHKREEKNMLMHVFAVYAHYLIWQRKAAKTAIKYHKKQSFDLVHHLTYGSLQLGSDMWRLKIPMIFGPVGGGQFPPKGYKKYFHNEWKRELMRIWMSKVLLTFNRSTRKVLKNSSVVLTSNEDTLLMAQKMGAKNVDLLVDIMLPQSFFPPQLPVHRKTKEFKILWTGSVIGRKALSLVLEALSHVPKDIPFQLTILGDGPLDKHIQSWIDEYDLNGRVDWPGRVSWEQLKQAYETHDLFLFCSLRDTSAAQFLEALAYGLPVVTLNLHGAKNVIPDNAGIKVEVKKPQETIANLADAVKYLYEKQDVYQEYSENAFAYAKTQVADVKQAKIAGYYDKILINK